MKHLRERTSRAEPKENESPATTEKPRRKRGRWWRKVAWVLLVLVVILAIGRAIMPWAVRDYVNKTLDRNPMYAGTIGDVQIHLYRGAYSIHDIRISKRTGNVPVPFFSAKAVDFAIQWKALLHHKIVGRVLMTEPQINFVDAPEEGGSQTGADAPWLQMISDLFPFKINSAIVQNGSVHFRAYKGSAPVDVYLSKMEASVDNLTNIQDESNPLISTVKAKAVAMDQAKFELNMTLDPFSYRPTFHLAMRLLGLDVTKINDLAMTYGKFNFKRGWFDLVVEADAKEGQINGYAKPLFRNLKVFSLTDDIKEDNVLQFFWQALVGGVTRALTNIPRDQFGTLIPFSGSMSGATSTGILQAIGNILRNAFIRAYLPRLEGGPQTVGGLTFEPAEITDSIPGE
jgi:hypothetical protein